MESVKLNRNSWHVRLNNYVFGGIQNDRQFCPYFWRTVVALLLFIPITTIGASAWIINKITTATVSAANFIIDKTKINKPPIAEVDREDKVEAMIQEREKFWESSEENKTIALGYYYNYDKTRRLSEYDKLAARRVGSKVYNSFEENIPQWEDLHIWNQHWSAMLREREKKIFEGLNLISKEQNWRETKEITLFILVVLNMIGLVGCLVEVSWLGFSHALGLITLIGIVIAIMGGLYTGWQFFKQYFKTVILQKYCPPIEWQ